MVDKIDFKHAYTTRTQDKLNREVWKVFSKGSTDVPALLTSAMLPKARKNQFTKPTVQFILSLIRERGNTPCLRDPVG